MKTGEIPENREQVDFSGGEIPENREQVNFSQGKIGKRVLEIFPLDPDEDGVRIVVRDVHGENLGTVSYKFGNQNIDSVNIKTCYVNFFATQNGRKDSEYSGKLKWLGEYSGSTKHIAYDMMEKFITTVCLPQGVQKIYLDADGTEKKIFWKKKMGEHLIQRGLIKKMYSQSTEVCYELIT